MVTELVRQIATLVGDDKGILVGAIEAHELEQAMGADDMRCGSSHCKWHPVCTVTVTHHLSSTINCQPSQFVCAPLAGWAEKWIADGQLCLCGFAAKSHWSVVPV